MRTLELLAPVKTVGSFTVKFKDDGERVVIGPKTYMFCLGHSLIESITDGNDVAFNNLLHIAPTDPATGEPDIEIALLQRLQAHYMTWRNHL